MKYCCKKFKDYAERGFIKPLARADSPPKNPKLEAHWGIVGANLQASDMEIMGLIYCPFCGKKWP